jgi:hypothetical protein
MHSSVDTTMIITTLTSFLSTYLDIISMTITTHENPLFLAAQIQISLSTCIIQIFQSFINFHSHSDELLINFIWSNGCQVLQSIFQLATNKQGSQYDRVLDNALSLFLVLIIEAKYAILLEVMELTPAVISIANSTINQGGISDEIRTKALIALANATLTVTASSSRSIASLQESMTL